MKTMQCYNENSIQKIFENDEFWENPLLKAINNGELTLEDYKYFFGQYYFYSKSFTHLITAGILKLQDDLHRSQLIENLWEECGKDNVEERHSEIFLRFLKNALHIDDPKATPIESSTKCFVDSMINYCLTENPRKVIAFLAFGVEGMVPQLYKIFVRGLRSLGFKDDDLKFFLLHIDCDDAHAATLKQIVINSLLDENSHDDLFGSIKTAYQLRGQFFKDIYQQLQQLKLKRMLTQLISYKQVNQVKPQQIHLYQNSDKKNGCDFWVSRLETASTVLDPRLLTVAPHANTECHRHAHETVFYVIEGSGHVKIDDEMIFISAGDVIHIPRWYYHQTCNTSDKLLKILAVTDFYLTNKIVGQSDRDYRQVSG